MKNSLWHWTETFFLQFALSGIRLTKALQNDTNILGISYIFIGIISTFSPHLDFSLWVTQKFGEYHFLIHLLLVVSGVLSIVLCRGKRCLVSTAILSIPFLIQFSLGLHYLIMTNSNMGELLYLFFVAAIFIRAIFLLLITETIKERKSGHG